MEDPLKAYNDVLKISREVTLQDIFDNIEKKQATYTRECPDGCGKKFNTVDDNAVAYHLYIDHGYSSEDAWKSAGLESYANEAPFVGMRKHERKWVCPDCGQNFPVIHSIDDIETYLPIKDHMKNGHGYTDTQADNVLAIDYHSDGAHEDNYYGQGKQGKQYFSGKWYGESKANEDYGYMNTIQNPNLTTHGYPRDEEGFARANWDDASIEDRKNWLIVNRQFDHDRAEDEAYLPYFSLDTMTRAELMKTLHVGGISAMGTGYIVTESYASEAERFSVGDYFIDDNNKYGKVLDILNEYEDAQFLDVQMTYGHTNVRSDAGYGLKKVNPSDIGEEEKNAIDNATESYASEGDDKRKRIKDWYGNTGTQKEDGSVVDDKDLIKSLEESYTSEVDASEKDDMFEFLFDLQESGVTNMFGAGPYVERAFPHLDKKEVRDVVLEWMKNYEEIADRMGIQF